MSFYTINRHNQLVCNYFNGTRNILNATVESISLEKNIENIIKYCQLLLYENDIFDDFEFNTEQLNIHKQFITKKLDYFNQLIEYKIESEIRDKYRILENILGHIEFEYIINEELIKNKHVRLSRDMLLEMILPTDNEF